MKLVLLIVSIVLFLLAAFGVTFPFLNILDLALAVFAASFLPVSE